MTSALAKQVTAAVRLAGLLERKEALGAELATVESEIASLRDRVVEEWLNSGQSSAKINGRTLYLAEKRWARFQGDDAEILRVLEEEHLDAVLVTRATYPNSASLGKWLRENEELPEALVPYVATGTHHEIRARRS